jgi:hypothetical protein
MLRPPYLHAQHRFGHSEGNNPLSPYRDLNPVIQPIVHHFTYRAIIHLQQSKSLWQWLNDCTNTSWAYVPSTLTGINLFCVEQKKNTAGLFFHRLALLPLCERHHSLVYISCYQSRHRQNLIFFCITRTAHSSSQAWRTMAIILVDRLILLDIVYHLRYIWYRL